MKTTNKAITSKNTKNSGNKDSGKPNSETKEKKITKPFNDDDEDAFDLSLDDELTSFDDMDDDDDY